jgi:hypothetical protein
MKKSTVAAGCIAGVVAACSGAGLEAIGDTMHDAGHAMAGVGGSLEAAGSGMSAGAGGMVGELVAGAGHLMADAGASVAAAGSSLVAGGSAGSSGAKAQESAGDGLPRPHWVLRDKNGTPVQAAVSPQRPAGSPRFASGTELGVWINDYGSKSIGLTYKLATGKPADENELPGGILTVATWHETSDRFLDAACQTSPVFATRYTVVSVANTLYYATDAAPAGTVYLWDGRTCTVPGGGGGGGTRYTMTPVPAEVANLLPNPPYTLELAY